MSELSLQEDSNNVSEQFTFHSCAAWPHYRTLHQIPTSTNFRLVSSGLVPQISYSKVSFTGLITGPQLLSAIQVGTLLFYPDFAFLTVLLCSRLGSGARALGPVGLHEMKEMWAGFLGIYSSVVSLIFT